MGDASFDADVVMIFFVFRVAILPCWGIFGFLETRNSLHHTIYREKEKNKNSYKVSRGVLFCPFLCA